MSKTRKNQRKILDKLGITELNPMQVEARLAIHSVDDVVLLSPTGTGKTLAFLLPVIAEMDPEIKGVQAMVIVPSRELAIQIEQVSREMGAGIKINCVYGGRPFSKDKMELITPPSLLIGTPGRVADHMRRGSFSVENIKMLVLDEFDKSLEVGFEEEMSEIILSLTNLKKKILTSATNGVVLPEFVTLVNPVEVNYLEEKIDQLTIKTIYSPKRDKLDTLFETLCFLGGQTGIVFCNFKDSIRRISEYLKDRGIEHGVFFGGMDQKDRERTLIKFRNGTHKIMIATDLAARGIDVSEINYIIHYHLPPREEEFTHRNGRTARMHTEGTAYVLQYIDEALPDFIGQREVQEIPEETLPHASKWSTLFVSGGRRDKISKGDIAGLFFNVAKLGKDELGMIELKQDCAFVAVPAKKAKNIVKFVDNRRIKKRKVRVTVI